MNKSLVNEQFGRSAHAYAVSDVHAKGASLAQLVAAVGPHKSWHMLDIATGAGHTALAFAPHVARAVASDLTPEMLTETAALAVERGFTNVETAIADAEFLPFGDATFDLVTCRLAAHHFPDPRAFVAEVRRVLKPHGTLGLVDNIAPDALILPGTPLEEIEAAADAYNAFEALRDPSHVRALAAAEWQLLIENGGFAVTHLERQTKSLDFLNFTERMSCSAAVTEELTSQLLNGSGALRRFLDPHLREGRQWFTLHEALIIARKS